MKKTLFCIVLTCLLGACSTTKIVERQYPDRITIQLSNPGTWEKSNYRCEKLATEDETQKNAVAAHAYLNQGIDAVTEQATANMLKSEKGSFGKSLQFSKEVNAGSQKVADELEEKFHCVLFKIK